MSEESREWKPQVGFSGEAISVGSSLALLRPHRDTEAILRFRSGPSPDLDHTDHELLSPRPIRNKFPWFTGNSSDSILLWHPMLT